MNQAAGRHVTWFELMAVVAIVGLGVGLWQLTTEIRGPSYLSLHPSETAFALKHGVPAAQAAYDADSNRLGEIQTQLVAVQEREHQSANARKTLLDDYSSLGALGDLSTLNQVPEEVVRAFIDNEVALASSVVLSETLGLHYRNLANASAAPTASGLEARVASLSSAQVDAARTQLVAATLKVVQQQAERELLSRQFPALAPLEAAPLPPTVVKVYVGALLDEQTATAERKDLEETLANQSTALLNHHMTLDAAQRAVAAELAAATEADAQAQRFDTMWHSILFFALALLALGVGFWLRFGAKESFWTHILLPSLLLTVIVYVYLWWPAGGILVGVALGLAIALAAMGRKYRA